MIFVFLGEGTEPGAGYQVGVEGEIPSSAGGEQEEGQEPGGQEGQEPGGQEGHAAPERRSRAVQYYSCVCHIAPICMPQLISKYTTDGRGLPSSVNLAGPGEILYNTKAKALGRS